MSFACLQSVCVRLRYIQKWPRQSGSHRVIHAYHADAGMLRTGDPAGLGRLRRDRGPGVRPRSVSYSGRRAAMGGG